MHEVWQNIIHNKKISHKTHIKTTMTIKKLFHLICALTIITTQRAHGSEFLTKAVHTYAPHAPFALITCGYFKETVVNL